MSTGYINITSPISSTSSSTLEIYYVSKVAWVSRQSPFSKVSKVFSNLSEIHYELVYRFDLPGVTSAALLLNVS